MLINQDVRCKCCKGAVILRREGSGPFPIVGVKSAAARGCVNQNFTFSFLSIDHSEKFYFIKSLSLMHITSYVNSISDFCEIQIKIVV